MKNKFFVVTLLIFASFTWAQNKQTLFTIDGNPYYTDEFSRVYKKNLELVKDDSQKDLDKYLELFVGYKLKVHKANQLGLQNQEKYINELKSYRNQLTKTYMNDSQVTSKLIEEAYQRMKEEVRASHILVMVDEGALPADTLKAYQKITDIKKRIEAGASFDDVAATLSEDPSAKENKGDLGYFSAFRMVYPFENAAFNTKVGQISTPFRTRFGYHILKVVDRRQNRGEVAVSHIMIAKKNDEATNQDVSKSVITQLYQKLKQGESFEELAKQFSDDKSTADKGGMLQRFGSGQLTSLEFEEKAFSLNNPEEYTEPFETQFGWHIVKLNQKFEIGSLIDLKNEIEGKIKRDERSVLITNSLASKLRGKYKITTDAKLKALVKKSVNDTFYTQNWQLPANRVPFDKALVTIDKASLTANQFLDYINNQQKGTIKTRPVANLVDELYENWLDEQVIAYYNGNLENEHPEFAHVMEEYRDGLLLFDLMEKEIWNRAKEDSIGLEKFRIENIQNYKWKERYDVAVYSSTKADVIKNVNKLLKKNKSEDFIKKTINTNDKVEVMVKSGIFEKGSDNLPVTEIMKTGISEVIEKNGYYFVIQVKNILPESEKTMAESKGKLISDYQQFLEKNWVDALKNEFKVIINQPVFDSIKKQM